MTLFPDDLMRWPLAAPISLQPIPRSENLLFRVDDARSHRFVLRLNRPGYHSLAEIRSELDWIAALRRDTAVLVPEVVPAGDGSAILSLTLAGEPAPRPAVLFVEHAGALPDRNDRRLPALFAALGEAAALCHRHVGSWVPPPGFSRPDWTIATTLGSRGIWGDWRGAPGVSGPDTVLLAEVEQRLHTQFDAYGRSSDRFGLIHNDMRFSNFLWHEGRLRLLDFDDCGYSWFIADFAASLSWHEDDPRAPELFRHWRQGYERHRRLGADDIAMAGPALMARRLLLLAWLGTRADTDLAKAHAAGFVTGTLGLARRFLGGDRLV